MAEILGKETIDLYNTSDTRGTSQSYGLNYQKTGKELMSQDEIAVMDGGKCIMQLRGVRPFFSNKFDITKHKQYRFLSHGKRRFYKLFINLEISVFTIKTIRKDAMVKLFCV